MTDNAPQRTLPDEKGRRLRTALDHRVIEKLLDRLDAAAPDDDQVLKIAATLCEIRKQDAAAEKNRLALDIAQLKDDKAARPQPAARLCEAGENPTTAPVGNAPSPAPDATGPDPKPHDLRRRLARTIRDIYGIADPAEAPSAARDDHRTGLTEPGSDGYTGKHPRSSKKPPAPSRPTDPAPRADSPSAVRTKNARSPPTATGPPGAARD